ncbi:MAG TPA: 3-deoxy-manno-octulosonate cytidylyltransferase [Steroidobacteraceae bacterium]|nr:3-deoxy-manno-octulosonate cytidylyltransferase [Steroidobacteraceae bacterium]
MSAPHRVVIPARYASTRLPGKVLLPIAGRPMLHWVCERARASTADEVIVAADDERIAAAARACGVQVVMTSTGHGSGTDRIAEVAWLRGWAAEDIVVNLQADEPLMPPVLIDQVCELLEAHAHAAIATLASPVGSLHEFLDPHVVKVVADRRERALYFSRAPIPWDRDGASADLATQRSFAGARRHLGLYAYRVGALQRLAALAPSPHELREKLEQLRALENGFEIVVANSREPPGADVNTSKDLERVRALLEAELGTGA